MFYTFNSTCHDRHGKYTLLVTCSVAFALLQRTKFQCLMKTNDRKPKEADRIGQRNTSLQFFPQPCVVARARVIRVFIKWLVFVDDMTRALIG